MPKRMVWMRRCCCGTTPLVEWGQPDGHNRRCWEMLPEPRGISSLAVPECYLLQTCLNSK